MSMHNSRAGQFGIGRAPIFRLLSFLRAKASSGQVATVKRREDDEALVSWLKALRARRPDSQ